MTTEQKTNDASACPLDGDVMPEDVILLPGDYEALQGMEKGVWFYTVGQHFGDCFERLKMAGLVESGPNPIGPWPAYKRGA